MKMVSILELKARLSAVIDQASRGARILITRHKRPVAFLQSADLEHLHFGKLVGKKSLKPLLRNATRGMYLKVLSEDRQGESGQGRGE